MRELQGGIITSSLFIIFLGISVLLTALLRFISPVTGGPPEFLTASSAGGAANGAQTAI